MQLINETKMTEIIFFMQYENKRVAKGKQGGRKRLL